MSNTFRYAVFLSYSSKDSNFARRLHRSLESYRIPRSCGRIELAGDTSKPNRVYPVFRDREELPAGKLDDAIRDALDASSALIVICSRASAQSDWVGREIAYFAQLGRRERIFTVIAEDTPEDFGGEDATALFCRSELLRDPVSGATFSLVAADARRSKDGFHRAMLKCVAGVSGLSLGKLIDRDRAAQRQRRLRTVSISSLIFLLLVTVVYGFKQQVQQSSNSLAELSATAARESNYDGATRFALAGMNGFDTPLIGFDPSAAEAQLLQTVAESHRVPGASAVFVNGGRNVISTAGVEIVTTDLETGALQRKASGHEESAETRILFLSPDEEILLTRGDDWTSIYNLKINTAIRCEPNATGAAGVGPDGKQILLAGTIGQDTGIFNLTTKKWVTKTTSEVKSFSPDGRWVVAAYEHYKFEIFDLTKGGTSRIIENATTSDVAIVRFSPDSRYLVAGGRDGTGETETGSFGAWEAETGKPIWPADVYGSPFISTKRWGNVQYSPDGSLVAIAAGDTILLIDPTTGKTTKPLSGRFSGVTEIAFSPDSQRLAFGADDRTIRLWDVHRAVEIGRFRGHNGPVTRLVFDQTGQRLMTEAEVATGGRSYGEVRVWSIEAALELRGRKLMDRARAVTLADGADGERRTTFTSAELARAPMLDPAIHSDASRLPSLLQRLQASFGW